MKVKAFPKIMGPHCDNILRMWGLLWFVGASIPKINDLVVRTLPKVFLKIPSIVGLTLL